MINSNRKNLTIPICNQKRKQRVIRRLTKSKSGLKKCQPINISIFGLGYVGVVLSACLSRDGHNVIGVDVNTSKTDLINKCCNPIVEPGIEDLVSKSVKQGMLQATKDYLKAVRDSDITFICVGTPSHTNGSLNLEAIKNVCKEIGIALQDKSKFHLVVIRSTIIPGTTRSLIIPILEKTSGKCAGKDFGVCINPEFLREGNALVDNDNPPKIVIGSTDKKSIKILKPIYKHHCAPLVVTNIEIAEMVKYTDNAWHAIKISFANEIGKYSKAINIDSHRVMDIFIKDNKLNLSPYYLRPGFAFGGSCLPKDVRALTYHGRALDIDLPLLNSIIQSNQSQIDNALKLIQAQGHKRIGILGISFKAETDDLRESPMIKVVEALIGSGYDIKILDQNVHLASLVGSNRDYILNQINHIHRLMTTDIEELLQHAKTIVIGVANKSYKNAISKLRPDQHVIDLVRIMEPDKKNNNYEGICW